MVKEKHNKIGDKLITSILRSPINLKELKLVSEDEFQNDLKEKYPVIEGIVCLLPEKERRLDLEDKRFYEEHPFGVRDWSNPEEVAAGVESDLKEFLKDLPKNTLIADIGAGSGRVSNYMSNIGFSNVVSLDNSLNSLRMVNEYSRSYCIWGNNLYLPFASNSVDVVISTGVIHHTSNPEKALAECARVLKKDGLLFLKLRNVHSLYGYLFHSYGVFLRYFEKRKKLNFLSNIFGFYIYKITRKVFYPHLPKRPNNELRGKYENLFIKDQITFFTTKKVENMLAENKLKPIKKQKSSITHRQHFYVCMKRELT